MGQQKHFILMNSGKLSTIKQNAGRLCRKLEQV